MSKIVSSEKDYMDLLRMMNSMDDDDFPILLEREDPEEITMVDVKEFIDKFKKDTGLDISFHLNTCDDCGRLHMTMAIDTREEYQYGKLHLLQ